MVVSKVETEGQTTIIALIDHGAIPSVFSLRIFKAHVWNPYANSALLNFNWITIKTQQYYLAGVVVLDQQLRCGVSDRSIVRRDAHRHGPGGVRGHRAIARRVGEAGFTGEVGVRCKGHHTFAV